MIAIDPGLLRAYPGASFGVLTVKGAGNPASHDELEARKRALEMERRDRFAGLSRSELKSQAPLDAYCAYYNRFGRTYHVLLQLESILKGKSLPRVAALIDAMFMAELHSLLLTAGHDLAELKPPLRLAVADGTGRYQGLSGGERQTVRGDMFLADDLGIVSSIMQGPDYRTRLKETTQDALFFVYAPPGVAAASIRRHLEELDRNIRLFAPELESSALEILP